jgi:hypothetical protein
MIEQILEALKLDLKSDSEYIKIAKGKYKLPMTIDDALKPFKNLFRRK